LPLFRRAMISSMTPSARSGARGSIIRRGEE
jgi:hypothetical protein